MGLDWNGWYWRNSAGSALARRTPALAADLRHGDDLAEIVTRDPPRWPDTLALETRRQLADCLMGVERAIGLLLTDRPFDALMGTMPPGFTMDALAQHPSLVSPDLLRHMRQRAALCIVSRAGRPSGQPLPFGGPLAELLGALNTAELAWHPRGSAAGAGPARADLPAEPFCDLAWTAAALIVQAIERMVGATSPSAVHAVSRATQALIGRHDEGQGAFALASRAARLIDDKSVPQFARRALVEGRLLLFAALAARSPGLALPDTLDLIVDGTMRDRLALLRLTGADDEAVAAFFGHVVPLHPRAAREDQGDEEAEDDIALPVELFRAYTLSDAQGWLARRVGPAALATRLWLLDRGQA